MNKAKKTWIITSFVILSFVVLLLIFCIVDYSLEYAITARFKCPVESWQNPNLTDEITDIRITTIERDFDYTRLVKTDENYQNLTLLQIYYGYLDNGVWYDFPCENFDIKDLRHNKTGIKAVTGDHCVKIGKYVLLCFQTSDALSADVIGVVEDSIDSGTIKMTEYASPSAELIGMNKIHYGRVVERVRGKYECNLYDGFPLCYYVILEYDKIPEDYEITFGRYFEHKDDSDKENVALRTLTGDDGVKRVYELVAEYTYTYDDIMEALNRE